uniref:Phytanoyl-CoA dioxygenase n=1 Tax=Branchiostoma floridae TaxID=7739 RepID=C3XT39_BRAFL|eukprot:XP_002612763.1 hypothetical protein BRAFLDRAFT_97256 [Branchiostoma floridae]
MPVDPVPMETCVQFVRGSQGWGWFCPRKFATTLNYSLTGGDTGSKTFRDVPDIDGDRDKYDILTWDVQPGDCIVFHMKTLHGAPANPSLSLRRRVVSTRWVGDDAVLAERPWEVSPPITGIEKNKAHPSRYSESLVGEGGPGAYFNDYCNWRSIPEFQDFVYNSPAAQIAAQLMDSQVRVPQHIAAQLMDSQVRVPQHIAAQLMDSQVRVQQHIAAQLMDSQVRVQQHIAAQLMDSQTAIFYHEHVLTKDPGTYKTTPWHHDQSYYPVDGDKSVITGATELSNCHRPTADVGGDE